MDIIGLLRVRNEAHIIQDTLDHMGEFCTGGVVVYDDASTDATPEICEHHPAVCRLLRGQVWQGDADRASRESKNAVLEAARQKAGPKDWLVYMDADERVEFDFDTLRGLPPGTVAVRMKLFDYYITAKDEPLPWQNRRWLGPEYREIDIAFRNLPTLSFYAGRQIKHPSDIGYILYQGYVRHYGKAISVEAWERKCRYYAEAYAGRPRGEKWAARKGKAVHAVSDFGLPLIRWEEREKKGVLLTPELVSRETY